jgi:hypothetical protein
VLNVLKDSLEKPARLALVEVTFSVTMESQELEHVRVSPTLTRLARNVLKASLVLNANPNALLLVLLEEPVTMA